LTSEEYKFVVFAMWGNQKHW